ncbi:MAG: ABC transporter permease [Deinococcota bacterium]
MTSPTSSAVGQSSPSPARSTGRWQKLFSRNETLVALIIIAYCALTSWRNPAFFSLGTLFDLLRGSIVMGMFAMGVLLVLISGGIDVSFTAIAVFSLYASTKIVVALNWGDSFIAAFVIACVIGLGLGLFNALFIALLKLPTLIVTLGTLSLFRGFLLTFIGSARITRVPNGMREMWGSRLVSFTTENGFFYALPTAFLFLVGTVVIVWFLLHRTMLGRQIFALGGSEVAARRAGIPVTRIKLFIYGFVGLLSGAAGIIHASLSRTADPFDLVGLELTVIAAVVLGGARLTGGSGTIIGTLLGVALIVIINNSLILLGIPSSWQTFIIGVLILLGTGIPAYQGRLAQQRVVS